MDTGERWYRRHALAICALTVLVVGLVLIVPVARSGAAPSVNGLEAKIDQAKAEAGDLKAQIQNQTQALFSAQAEAEAAASREGRISATLAGGQRRAARLARQVEAASADLRDQRNRLGRAQRALGDRLVAIYKSGTPDEVTVLLNADGFDDMATRYELLSRIEAADAALVLRVSELGDEVEARLESVRASKQKVDAFNARLERARDQIAAARAAAQAHASELAAAGDARSATLDELDSKMADWTKQVEAAEAETPEAAADEVDGWTGDWAIPTYIVMCESGGDYTAVNPSSGAGGAYQILPSTWAAYGGEGLPNEAPPAEQDRIAAMIWADSGGSAWVCAG